MPLAGRKRLFSRVRLVQKTVVSGGSPLAVGSTNSRLAGRISTGWKTTDWATADPGAVAWQVAAKRMAVVEERLLNCTSIEHGRYRPTPTALAGDLSGVWPRSRGSMCPQGLSRGPRLEVAVGSANGPRAIRHYRGGQRIAGKRSDRGKREDAAGRIARRIGTCLRLQTLRLAIAW